MISMILEKQFFSYNHDFIVFLSFQDYFLFSVVSRACKECSTSKFFSYIHDFTVFLSFQEYFLFSVVYKACKEHSTSF